MSSFSDPRNSPAADGPALGHVRDYILLEELGAGGMGKVYKALHSRLGKTVALKLLPREHTQDPHAVARFEREMLAIGRFDHPNIVKAFDAGQCDGAHFLAMEYVDGCDVAKIVDAHGPLDVADACAIAVQGA